MTDRIKTIEHPEKISSYFKAQIPILIVVTISGLGYNIGLLAGPYFEGQLVQCLYDIANGTAQPADMIHLAVLYLLVIAVVQVMRAIKRFGVRRFGNEISRNMRHILYGSLIRMTPEQLEHEKLGSLLTKAIADVDTCAEGMRKFTTEIFDTGVVMIAYLGMLLHYDWRLTILCCLFTPLAYLAAARLRTRVAAASSAYKQSAAVLNQVTLDRIDSALTYRVFGRESSRNQAYESALQDYEHKSARANIYEGSLAPLYDAVAMIGAVMILYFGSRNVVGTGWTQWNLAAFTAYLACFTKLAVKVSHGAKLFNAVQKARVSWQRIQPLMQQIAPADETVIDTPVQPAVLQVQDLTCGYQEPLLHDISFTARPGEIIGITGEVASGKSLLGKVFIDLAPYTGTITLNGQNIADLTPAQRHGWISYQGHEPELISGTIQDNIALGDDLDVWKYLKLVDLDEEVRRMPQQEQTYIGEGGMQLSGGQQSRLALARTLAHGRSVLILDDPLAAVDRASETTILQNLKQACSQQTILLISHRLYHFPEFSGVLFLHDGTADFASHADMLKKQPGYARLYEEQQKGGDLDDTQK